MTGIEEGTMGSKKSGGCVYISVDDFSVRFC